jgi:hypothetical protein
MRPKVKDTKRSRAVSQGRFDKPMTSNVRKPYTFSLSKICDEAIDKLALTFQCSRSAAIERVFTLDYADLFRRFKDGESFVDIVIATRIDPDWVQIVYDKYMKGFEKVSLMDSESLDKELQAELAALDAKLEVQTSKVESNERIEMAKIESRKDMADRRLKLAAERASNQARIERLRALSAPPPNFRAR